MNFSKMLIETDDIATKREAYYVSKNWGDAMFKEHRVGMVDPHIGQHPGELRIGEFAWSRL